jgi:3-hydroxyisobutyrate dehydrogenase
MHSNLHPTIAVLGTGLIGAPVARNLQRKGFTVRAWNRTAARAQALAHDGVQVCGDAADAVRGARIIVTVLKDGPAVLQAMQAAAPALQPGTLWLQLSTVGVDAIVPLAQFAERQGLVFSSRASWSSWPQARWRSAARYSRCSMP